MVLVGFRYAYYLHRYDLLWIMVWINQNESIINGVILNNEICSHLHTIIDNHSFLRVGNVLMIMNLSHGKDEIMPELYFMN
ncbi:hypothetical protein EAE91_22560 [Photorhabdus noenieputensis]|nr:hypothetical protein [Photorhabdus noenieputensis]